MSCVLPSAESVAQRPDCLAGVEGFELELFSITLTQLLCHAPRSGASSTHRECSGNPARPVVTGSSAFADDDIMWCANVIEKRSRLGMAESKSAAYRLCPTEATEITSA